MGRQAVDASQHPLSSTVYVLEEGMQQKPAIQLKAI
jgi:hypothetical protein